MADKIKLAENEAVDWLLGRLKSRNDGPVRGQVKGPIFSGPPSYVVCPMCIATFGTKARPVYGIARKHQRAHLAAHKAGLIGKVEDVQ